MVGSTTIIALCDFFSLCCLNRLWCFCRGYAFNIHYSFTCAELIATNGSLVDSMTTKVGFVVTKLTQKKQCIVEVEHKEVPLAREGRKLACSVKQWLSVSPCQPVNVLAITDRWS